MHLIVLDTPLTRQHIAADHLRWLRWWIKKLELKKCHFGIIVLEKIPGETKRLQVNARVDLVSGKDHLYLLIFAERTMRNDNSWKSAFVHELLHVLYSETSHLGHAEQEEILVTWLAPLLASIANLAGELSVKMLSQKRG